jgi:nitroreductase
MSRIRLRKLQGTAYFQAIGVERGSEESRKPSREEALGVFGAPHALLLFMPAFNDDVRGTSDIGMYAQTFLLSLAAHGLAEVPQTYLGFYADTVREQLKVDQTFKMLIGLSFGYPDVGSPASSFRIEKARIQENVTFHV